MSYSTAIVVCLFEYGIRFGTFRSCTFDANRFTDGRYPISVGQKQGKTDFNCVLTIIIYKKIIILVIIRNLSIVMIVIITFMGKVNDYLYIV